MTSYLPTYITLYYTVRTHDADIRTSTFYDLFDFTFIIFM